MRLQLSSESAVVILLFGVLLQRTAAETSTSKNIGLSCTTREDCATTVANGGTGECEGGRCACHNGYLPTLGGCALNQNGLGCLTNLFCPSGSPAYTGNCVSHRCECSPNFIQMGLECVHESGDTSIGAGNRCSDYLTDPGKICSSNTDCPLTSLAYTGQCRSSRCQCSPNHVMKGRICIDESNDPWADSGLGCDAYLSDPGKICSSNTDCSSTSPAYTGQCRSSRCQCSTGHVVKGRFCVGGAVSIKASSVLVALATAMFAFLVAA